MCIFQIRLDLKDTQNISLLYNSSKLFVSCQVTNNGKHLRCMLSLRDLSASVYYPLRRQKCASIIIWVIIASDLVKYLVVVVIGRRQSLQKNNINTMR